MLVFFIVRVSIIFAIYAHVVVTVDALLWIIHFVFEFEGVCRRRIVVVVFLLLLLLLFIIMVALRQHGLAASEGGFRGHGEEACS